jgi:hypothetical protein
MTGVEDVQALTTLLAQYASRLDREDHEGFADLWADDGRFLVFGRSFDGRAGVLKMATTAPAGLHMTGPAVFDLQGDRATAQQSFLFVDRATGQQRLGFYDDDLVRTPAGWRFQTRKVTFLTKDGPSDMP